MTHVHFQVQIRGALDHMTIAFSEEVTDSERDKLESTVRELRFPMSQSPLDIFAFKHSQTAGKYRTYKPAKKSHHKMNKNIKGMTIGWSKTSKQLQATNNQQQHLPTINEAVRSTLSNKSTLEKMTSRTARNDDFARLGLIDDTSPVTTARNKFMVLCKTYPTVMLQPRVMVTNDNSKLIALAKNFKRQRIPTIIWRHSNGAMLCRSESFSSTTTSTLFHKKRNTIDERDIRSPHYCLEVWLLALVNMTPKKINSNSILQKADASHYASNNSLASTHLSTTPSGSPSRPLSLADGGGNFIRGFSNTIRESAKGTVDLDCDLS